MARRPQGHVLLTVAGDLPTDQAVLPRSPQRAVADQPVDNCRSMIGCCSFGRCSRVGEAGPAVVPSSVTLTSVVVFAYGAAQAGWRARAPSRRPHRRPGPGSTAPAATGQARR